MLAFTGPRDLAKLCVLLLDVEVWVLFQYLIPRSYQALEILRLAVCLGRTANGKTTARAGW